MRQVPSVVLSHTFRTILGATSHYYHPLENKMIIPISPSPSAQSYPIPTHSRHVVTLAQPRDSRRHASQISSAHQHIRDSSLPHVRRLIVPNACQLSLQTSTERYDLAMGNIGQLSALMYSTFKVRNRYKSVPESLPGSSMLMQASR